MDMSMLSLCVYYVWNHFVKLGSYNVFGKDFQRRFKTEIFN